MSVFSLGIMPYITAPDHLPDDTVNYSILAGKDGEAASVRHHYTRYLTVGSSAQCGWLPVLV